MLGLSQSGPAINSYTSQLFHHVSPDFTRSRDVSRATTHPSKFNSRSGSGCPNRDFPLPRFAMPQEIFLISKPCNCGEGQSTHTQKKRNKAIAISVPIATPMYKLPHVHCSPHPLELKQFNFVPSLTVFNRQCLLYNRPRKPALNCELWGRHFVDVHRYFRRSFTTRHRRRCQPTTNTPYVLTLRGNCPRTPAVFGLL